MKKRILATLLSLCLVIGLLPVTAMAADDPVLSGYCGADASYESQTYNCSTQYQSSTKTFTGTYYKNAIWTLTENETLSDDNTKTYKLTISGTGAMGDFVDSWSFGKPWNYELAEKENIAVTESRNRITAIEISNGITRIGNYAFHGLANITEVIIPASVSEIGEKAFQGCANLTSVKFPTSLKVLGYQSFAECGFSAISLPDGLETIGNAAFYLCKKLTGDLTIPNSVKTIGSSAFNGCDGLTGTLTLGSGVETIGDGAFTGTKFTGSLTLPESVKTVEKAPFGNATSGAVSESFKVFLNNTLETIGEAAFQEMTLDETLVIPQSVTSIANKAFYNAKGVNVIRFAGGTPSIGDQAFYGMKSVHSLDVTALPENTTYGNQAFSEWGTSQENAYSIIVYVKNETQKTNVTSAISDAEYRNSFAVTNGGTLGPNTTFTANTLATPTKEGYTFGGWYSNDSFTDSNKVMESTTISKGTNYFAKWVKVISFDGNGATSGSMDKLTVTEGDESTKLTSNGFSKTGYTFTGWNTQADGQSTPYAADTVASNVPNGTTLYAQWTPNTYTISFNGGEGAEGATASVNATYDVSVALTTNGFTKTDMQFKGWDTNPSASSVVYTNNAQVTNLTAESGATVPLYAVWAEKDELTPIIETPQHKTYNGETQEFTLDGDYTITYQQNDQPVTPVNAGTYNVVITKEATETTKAYNNTVTGGLVIDKANVTNTTNDSVHHTFGTTYDVSGLFNIDANAGDATYMLAENTAEGAGIATLDGTTLTITKAGTINVTLTTAATANYNAGTEITATLTVDKIVPQPTIKANGQTALTMSGGGNVTLTLADVPDGLTVTVNYINEADSGNVITVEPVDGVYSVTFPNESATYTFSVETGATDNYAMGVGNCTVTVTRYYSSGGSSSSNTSTSTTKNPDGSTTTTTTDKKTGTVTETTKNTDGSTTTVETKKDGTVTETNKTADGTTGTVVTDKNGDITEVKSTVSTKAATEAAKTGEAVTLPVEVPAAKTTEDAPAVQVTVPKSAGSVKVEVPVEKVTPGTVAVLVKSDGTEEIVKTSTLTEDGVVLKLEGNATVKVIDNAKDFSDTNGHWAEDAIAFVTAREMFAGTTTTTFTPNSQMTRAQLMTVLARFDGVDTNGGSVWYEKGMEWAKANGVSDGSNPNGSITREQLATMLWRYSGSPVVEGGIDSFQDAGKVNGYASDAMRWAVETGLIGGIGNNTLAPQGNATRAQLATILMRYCENLAQ